METNKNLIPEKETEGVTPEDLKALQGEEVKDVQTFTTTSKPLPSEKFEEKTDKELSKMAFASSAKVIAKSLQSEKPDFGKMAELEHQNFGLTPFFRVADSVGEKIWKDYVLPLQKENQELLNKISMLEMSYETSVMFKDSRISELEKEVKRLNGLLKIATA